MDKKLLKIILFMEANPYRDLNTDEELRAIRAIRELLCSGEYRDDFEIKSLSAVRAADLHNAVVDTRPKPHIVHFSGHGEGEAGIVVKDADGGDMLLPTERLEALFRLFNSDFYANDYLYRKAEWARNLECVILSACYSEAQAQAIIPHVDYVIGMDEQIADTAAQAFARGFYKALFSGANIPFAFENGRETIAREVSQEQAEVPRLFTKPASSKSYPPEVKAFPLSQEETKRYGENKSDEVLLAWLGEADLKSADSLDGPNKGPVADAVKHESSRLLWLLDDFRNADSEHYARQLRKRFPQLAVYLYQAELHRGPADLEQILRHAQDCLKQVREETPQVSRYTFLTNSGTKTMSFVWGLLCHKYRPNLLDCSRENGVRRLPFPVLE